MPPACSAETLLNLVPYLARAELDEVSLGKLVRCELDFGYKILAADLDRSFFSLDVLGLRELQTDFGLEYSVIGILALIASASLLVLNTDDLDEPLVTAADLTRRGMFTDFSRNLLSSPARLVMRMAFLLAC